MNRHERRREGKLATQFRASAPSSYNAETHTVDLTAATGTRVKRYSWMMDGYYYEELAMTPEACDLGRVAQGQCPVLDSHSRWSVNDQLGLVEGARFENAELVLSCRFGTRQAALDAEADVAGGTLRGTSIGYAINEFTLTGMQDDIPVYLATRWELLEVSLCPVPADPAAGVRSEDGSHPCIIIQPKETRTMDPEEEARIAREAEALAAANARANPTSPAPAPTPTAPAAPDASAARMTAAEALSFVDDARAFSEEIGTQARTWATTMTPEAARSQLLRSAADLQRQQAPTTPGQGAIRITQDERDTMRSAMTAALLHKFDPQRHQLSDAGREWRGMSLLEMGRANLEANGERTRGLNKRELADLMLRQNSTSDFPNILGNTVNRTLRDGYTAAPQTFKAWQRRATVSDFRQVSRLVMGSAPSFLLVPEGGQFKMGTLGDGKEVYALATYGRKFAITRQVLINDDLDAFTRIPSMFGAAAARFESDAAYAPLIANPNMADGVALFHASHANLAASGGAIAESTVQAGEVAIGNQTGLQGEVLNLSPKFFLTARKDKVAAQKLLSAIQATTTGDVNVYASSMELIVESRLNRSSGATPWFMIADSSQIDTVEYAYLEGDDGVFLDEREGFDVDGMEYKARLDFAVKAIDYRGMYMNPGT